tara:strand:+ start:2163 stop:2405 length:243 start_codon:yes stop_codon:yes gene_type:complete
MIAEAITWRDALRWTGIIVPLVGIAFWVGVQLTSIQTAIATVQADVTEIKVAVRAHGNLPAHPLAAHRIRVLERAATAAR